MRNLLICLVFILTSCVKTVDKNSYKELGYEKPPAYVSTYPEIDYGDFYVIELDGCEYIIIRSYNSTTKGIISISHKGNCKYCEKRHGIHD